MTRTLDEVRAVRRRFGVTPNDVMLAACAGALRRFAELRGEPPQPLKAMVPADVRSSSDAAGTGNRISFVFITLPCAEPDPVERLQAISRATAQRGRDGAAEDLDAAFRVLARTPTPLQHALAHAFAHPRLFNLTISSVPGPAVPRYLRGCRLREVHSAVPLTGRHALSIGVVTVAAERLLRHHRGRGRAARRRRARCRARRRDGRAQRRSRSSLSRRRSWPLARRIARAITGAATFAKPAGSPRLRSVMRVAPSPASSKL